MLDETLEYLEQRASKDSTFTYELVIVDDGSRDKTSEVALNYAKHQKVDTIRVLTLAKNRGKGGAVRRVSISFFIPPSTLFNSFDLSF